MSGCVSFSPVKVLWGRAAFMVFIQLTIVFWVGRV